MSDIAMKNIIRWGIAGVGNVVLTKSGPAFRTTRYAVLQAIMRRDADSARQSAEVLGAAAWCMTIEDLAASPEIDAVYIATPPGLHAEQALVCLKHRKPVYLEKPAARNWPEAVAIVEAFRAEGVPLFIAHYRRALPKFRTLKTLIDEGAIGRVREVDFRLTRTPGGDAGQGWLFDPPLSGGGKFVDIAPHTIDILIHLFGRFTEVNGSASGRIPGPLEEVVSMSFRSESGVIGSASFNLIAPTKGDTARVYGEAGEIVFSMHGTDGITITTPTGTRHIPEDPPAFIQAPMIQAVTDALLGRPAPICTGEDSLETYRVIDAVLERFYGGREAGFWERLPR